MKYLVTAEEMRRYDTNTIEYLEIPQMVLMERAALSVKEQIELRRKDKDKKTSVLIACGGGNNGAAGVALARLLMEDHKYCVTVLEISSSSKTEAKILQRRIAKRFGVQFTVKMPEDEFDFVIDSLFGTGLSRNIMGQIQDIIRDLNKKNGIHIAMDIPSGLNADDGRIMGEAFYADFTISFGFEKLGTCFYPAKNFCGEKIISEMGITEESFLEETPEHFCYEEKIQNYMPKRRPDGNKGTFGKVLLIAGSKEYGGACILAGKAALHAGAGMIKIVTSEENKNAILKELPEAIIRTDASLEDETKRLEEDETWADLIVIGPGIGQSKMAHKRMEWIVQKSKKPVIIDADGLNIMADNKEIYKAFFHKNQSMILTPHPGEFCRLSNIPMRTLKEETEDNLKDFCKDFGGTLVYKDAITRIMNKNEKIFINRTGNSGMGTAGSGDVLTGIIAGIFAQMLNDKEKKTNDCNEIGFYASCTGVYLHGLAGDLMAKRKNEWSLVASDLINAMDEIL